MATFVLVQGAFVGGWCWRWVASELRSTGHEVHAPTLTGLGERLHLASPRVDLDTHIEDVANVLRYEDLAGVVLVGWSYGGMAVAGAADRVPERVTHLVYLDSDVPRDGDTSVPPGQHTAREALAGAHGEGWRIPPAVTPAGRLLLAELPEERGAGSPRAWRRIHSKPGFSRSGCPARPPRSRPPTSAAWSATTRPTRTASARTHGSAASRAGATGNWPLAMPPPSRRRRPWPGCSR